jgi:hypothetical protein
LYGSKDSTREAFKQGLIEAGEIWMDMITSRNLSSHTYNQDLADEIVRKIIERYFAEFKRLVHRMQEIIDGDISYHEIWPSRDNYREYSGSIGAISPD